MLFPCRGWVQPGFAAGARLLGEPEANCVHVAVESETVDVIKEETVKEERRVFEAGCRNGFSSASTCLWILESQNHGEDWWWEGAECASSDWLHLQNASGARLSRLHARRGLTIWHNITFKLLNLTTWQLMTQSALLRVLHTWIQDSPSYRLINWACSRTPP